MTSRSPLRTAPNLRGAVIVTTPQDVAVADAVKALRFIGKLELPVLGIIENMNGLVCPHCGESVDLFGRGGGERAAQEFGVPYLGAIPLDPEMMRRPETKGVRTSFSTPAPRPGKAVDHGDGEPGRHGRALTECSAAVMYSFVTLRSEGMVAMPLA